MSKEPTDCLRCVLTDAGSFGGLRNWLVKMTAVEMPTYVQAVINNNQPYSRSCNSRNQQSASGSKIV